MNKAFLKSETEKFTANGGTITYAPTRKAKGWKEGRKMGQRFFTAALLKREDAGKGDLFSVVSRPLVGKTRV